MPIKYLIQTKIKVSISYLLHGRKAYSDIGKAFLQNAPMSEAYKYLRSARKSANLTQEFIAKACGVSRNAVTQWESLNADTRTEPSIDNLKIISRLTGMAIANLVGMEANEQEIREPGNRYQLASSRLMQIPLITWRQANTLGKPTDLHQLGRIKERVSKLGGGDNVYALKVKDSSMTSPSGVTPSFPKGYIIHVDSEQTANSQDCVLAKLKGHDQLVFKQLMEDGGKTYLHSLDPSLPNIFDEFTIVGKVIAASLTL